MNQDDTRVALLFDGRNDDVDPTLALLHDALVDGLSAGGWAVDDWCPRNERMSQEGSEKSAAGSSGSLLDELAYWIAAAGAGETAPAFNVLIHALGSVGVLALLEMPQLEHWVDSHVMGRRARL